MEQRLIDANALLLKFIAEFCGYGTCLSSTGQIAVRLLIDDAPTIEARPVVHGRWVPETVKRENPLSPLEEYVFDTMICSGCGAGFDVSEAMNFCPNCGADMREEVQNAGD